MTSTRFDLLTESGCILCRHLGWGETPAQIHHLRSGVGMGQRSSEDRTIPLCRSHHVGPKGFHGLGRRAFERLYGVTEEDLLAMADAEVSRLRTLQIGVNDV